MLDIKEGCTVKLRNGQIRGPLRDRALENDMWPWGELCEYCGQSLNGMYWRPDGKYSMYDEEHESQYDIVEVLDIKWIPPLNLPAPSKRKPDGQGGN